MLIHIRPRFFSRDNNSKGVTLDRFTVEPFGLDLRRDVDLMTQQPYPNKRYVVGCRKQGRRAIDGILIQTIGSVDHFETTAYWNIASRLAVHRISYTLLDHDFEAASDCIVLWLGYYGDDKWKCRAPEWVMRQKQNGICGLEPAMNTDGQDIPGKVLKTVDILGITDEIVATRYQKFSMPTLQTERVLTDRFDNRLPKLKDAFAC